MSALVGELRPDSWPKPNYVDPDTRTPLILGFMISGAVLSLMFTAGRLFAKAKRSNKGALGSDDWLMAVSAIMMLGVNVLGCVSTTVGSGYHTWDVRAEWPIIWGKIDLATYVLFIPSVSITKISLCVSYLKLFPSRTNQWFCYITIAFLTLWSLTFIFLMMFACRPISGFWDPTLPYARCLHIKALLILTGALNSVTDFGVFLWPVKTLWQVQLPLLHRVSLVVAFGIGCLVCIAGVVRAWYMEVYFSSPDPYWKSAILWVIVSVEGNFGIVCGCLPTLKPLARMLFPRFFGSRSDLAVNNHKSVELVEQAVSDEDPEDWEVVVEFPFGNISVPGRGGDGTVIDVEIEEGKTSVDLQSLEAVHGRRRRDDDVWAEVDTRMPAGGFKILRTVTLHDSRRNSAQEEGNRHYSAQSAAPSTRTVDDDDSSEEHILRRPWTGWSKERK